MGSGADSGNRRSSQIAEYFARLAATYGDGKYYGKRRRAVLVAIADEIAKARDILDVGCGNGTYLAEFAAAPNNRTVTGVDLSFEMLLASRDRVGTKCRLLRGDATRLPFKAQSFDFIFASHVLQFVSDLDGLAVEIARCLRPGGMIVASGQRDDGVRKVLSAIVGPDRWREYREVVFRRAQRREADVGPRDLYQRAFAKAELCVEERAAPFTVTWPDVEEWINIRWTPLIPAAERERADAMIAEVAKLGGSAPLSMHEPLIVAVRDP